MAGDLDKGGGARTSLAGKLEDLSLGEILQIVSLSQRSGILRLQGKEGEAQLFITGGKIVHATSSRDQEGFLSFLLQRRLLDTSRLEGIKDRLHEGMDPGALLDLLEKAGMSPASLQQALRRRIEEIVYGLFLWEEGAFSFELLDSKDPGEGMEGNAFFLRQGINPQFLVMEGARRKDEMGRGNVEGATLFPPPAEGEEPEEAGEGGGEAEAPLLHETPAQRMAREVEGFSAPSSLPRQQGEASRVALAVLASPHLRARLKEELERNNAGMLSFPDGATALTGIQDLRARQVTPVLVMDLTAPAITDSVELGGLEILTTLWELGMSLPTVLVSGGDLPLGLARKLEGVRGVELVRAGKERGEESRLVEKVLGLMEGGGKAAREEEFFDIRKELSGDLAGMDFPLDQWQGAASPTTSPSEDPLMETLRSYVGELARPGAGGEVTLLALRFASECLSRCVLFLVRKSDLKGLGQSGVDLGPGKDPNRSIQSLEVPLSPGGIFSRVMTNYRSYRGAPTESPEEQAVLAALGGARPREIYLGPIVSMGRVAVLLYGDDAPEGNGLPPTQALDVFLSHVGLALDRAFLEMKLGARRG